MMMIKRRVAFAQQEYFFSVVCVVFDQRLLSLTLHHHDWTRVFPSNFAAAVVVFMMMIETSEVSVV